jgi:selenide,water dikinase
LLSEILAGSPVNVAFPDLLVGTETSDDAAVYRINDEQAIVATTDFFMPIVDDPYDFGRIAATNAISDVYAMGGTPFLALALLGVPVGKLPSAAIRRILQGGEAVCAAAGVPVGGGHSIDSPEPIYGLVALGLVHPRNVKRNVGARAGDVLILGKPLGIGVLSAALKKGELDASGYRQMVDTATKLNRPGTTLSKLSGVHAMTDVTGFGLLGHLLEMCRGSKLRATLALADIPMLEAARVLAQRGHATGASDRNWSSYESQVTLPPGVSEWERKLLTDPQTSGGLLVACDPACAGEVLGAFREDGFGDARAIGRLAAGSPGITVA